MRRPHFLAVLAASLLVFSSIAEAQTPLRQSTSRVVRICGAVAVADGFTPVTTLALGAADEAEALRDNTATLDISGATFAAITGADGCYSLTLDTTATNTVGELVIVIQDDSLILPIRRTFQVVEEAVFDAFYVASADLDVNLEDGAITAAVIGTAAIDADAIATDAIGSAELAASAGTELGTANWASAARTLTAATNITSTGGTTVPQTGDSFARIGVNGAGLSNIGTIATVTNLTNLPSIPANWITAAGIAAGALNGRGDWNIGKTGYTLSQAFPPNFADLDIEATTGHVDVGFWNGTEITSPLQTADDVVTALLAATVDGAINVRCALALTIAYSANPWNQAGAVVNYRNPGDTANRITGTIGATSFSTVTHNCP